MQQTLSIRLSTGGFALAVYDPVADPPLSVTERGINVSLSLTSNLKAVCNEPDFPAGDFRRVNILMADKRFITVPMELFEESQAELLFFHNHVRRNNEIILFNLLRKESAVVIFSMDKSAHTFLHDRYPEARFYAQAAPLIEYFSAKSRLGNNQKMYAFLYNEGIHLFCFERGRLLLANSFGCTQTADRVYYLLYTWKQLEFDQERDELHLSGTLADKEQLLHELKEYIREVFVMNPAANIDFEASLICE